MNTAEIRARLAKRTETLVARDAALQKHLRGADGRLEADFSDRVAYTEMDEVLEALDDGARAELEAIRAALLRLDEGSYGTCTRCGEAIPEGRLIALPHTALCTACAAEVNG